MAGHHPDGTQYFFGKGKADGAATATNATWSVPVSGNHSAEPGYNSSFASSFVLRPWRWNLDYVVSPTGVTMTYFYVKETNKYKKNLATSTSYDRGGYLSKIQYGERKGAETVDDSPAKVTFTVEERCDTTISSGCKTTKPTSSTAKAWPDVPMDAVCDADYCPSQKTAPTFFSRKRLKQVDTYTRNAAGTAWEAVDSWVLAGSFPKPSDGERCRRCGCRRSPGPAKRPVPRSRYPQSTCRLSCSTPASAVPGSRWRNHDWRW